MIRAICFVVSDPSNKHVIFHRSPEPSTFPGCPAQPTVNGITQTSVSLAWKANANHGASLCALTLWNTSGIINNNGHMWRRYYTLLYVDYYRYNVFFFMIG